MGLQNSVSPSEAEICQFKFCEKGGFLGAQKMRFPGEFFGDCFFGISLTYEPSDPVKRTSILFTSQYAAVDPLLFR